MVGKIACCCNEMTHRDRPLHAAFGEVLNSRDPLAAGFEV